MSPNLFRYLKILILQFYSDLLLLQVGEVQFLPKHLKMVLLRLHRLQIYLKINKINNNIDLKNVTEKLPFSFNRRFNFVVTPVPRLLNFQNMKSKI
jgi:hypothetical protein